MTKHSKAPPPKFTGDLAAPILAPFEMPRRDDAGKLLVTIGPAFLEQLRKLKLLALHYESFGDEGIDFVKLAYATAVDLVPGFQILYDDPVARALKLPNAFRGKTKPKGAGTLSETASGENLLIIFRAMKIAFPSKSESALSEIIAECFIPELTRPQRASDRKRIGKTLRNRLAIARRKVSAAQV